MCDHLHSTQTVSLLPHSPQLYNSCTIQRSGYVIFLRYSGRLEKFDKLGVDVNGGVSELAGDIKFFKIKIRTGFRSNLQDSMNIASRTVFLNPSTGRNVRSS